MTDDEAREMQRDLVHDLGEAARAAQAQLASQTKASPRLPHWLGEMLHPDDTTRNGW